MTRYLSFLHFLGRNAQDALKVQSWFDIGGSRGGKRKERKEKKRAGGIRMNEKGKKLEDRNGRER